jgi:hypothetical protein
MKKIHIFLCLIISGIALTSCENFLEVSPKNAVPNETAISDKKSAEQALRGVYRAIGSYKQSYITLNILAGGDATFNNVGDPHLIISHDYRADNSNINSPWSGAYKAINQANFVIQKVPALNDPLLTQANKNQILGEALFLRALAYFDLVRLWGGVPLKLIPTENLNQPLGIARSSAEETYGQILKDLTAADDLLNTVAVNRIKVSKNAVQALKSRLYLYQKKWPEAEESANLLINNINYKLLFPFTAWFKGDLGSQESIFEIANTLINPNGLRSSFQHQTRGGSYSLAPKVSTANLLNDPAIGGGTTGRRSLIGSVIQTGTTIWYGDLYFRNPATDPIYVLRIAEQYLIRAEARIYNDDLPGALADINEIRRRANLTELTQNNYDINNPQQLLLAIENERRFEFLWEEDRWADLVRTGRAKDVFQIEDYKLLLPIPLDEVVIGKLEQNHLYK